MAVKSTSLEKGSNPVAPTSKSATYDENLSGFFHG